MGRCASSSPLTWEGDVQDPRVTFGFPPHTERRTAAVWRKEAVQIRVGPATRAWVGVRASTGSGSKRADRFRARPRPPVAHPSCTVGTFIKSDLRDLAR